MEKNSVNHILFDFNTIIDTDIGIAMLMNKKYNNPNIINPMVIGKSIEDYKILMINRKYSNPLVMFLNKDYQAEADNLYIELTMKPENYQEVLNMSITTAIFNLLTEALSTTALEPTVLCWNQEQADYLKSLKPEIDIVIRDGDNPVDVEKYDTLIFKYPYPINLFTCGTRELGGKNIYICKYRCNMNPSDISKLNVTDTIKLYHLDANDIYIIDVYADTQLENIAKEEINNG